MYMRGCVFRLSLLFVLIHFAHVLGLFLGVSVKVLYFQALTVQNCLLLLLIRLSLLFLFGALIGCNALASDGKTNVDVLLFDELPEQYLPPSVAARELLINLHQQKEKALTAWLAGELEPERYRAVIDSLSELSIDVAAYLAPEDSLLPELLLESFLNSYGSMSSFISSSRVGIIGPGSVVIIISLGCWFGSVCSILCVGRPYRYSKNILIAQRSPAFNPASSCLNASSSNAVSRSISWLSCSLGLRPPGFPLCPFTNGIYCYLHC
jgi:hypothetical protein